MNRTPAAPPPDDTAPDRGPETLPSEAVAAQMQGVRAPGIAAAVVAGGRVAWQGATGVRDAASGAPVEERTAFHWFSMTKIATATAVMQLVEAGDIRLDAPAREHLPDLDDLDPRITTRQLLNHSSGIANPAPLKWIHHPGERGPDPRALVEELLSRYGRPKFEPGDHSAYTNIGYLVLGEVIAAASGRPYKLYVVERVLRPLGANATAFTLDASGEIHPATGYHPRRDPLLPVFRMLLPRWVIGPPVGRWRSFAPFLLDGSAYGGLIGPVADAALLAAAHLGGGEVDGRRILSPESVAEMQRIETPGRKCDLGLGWFRPHRDSKRGRRFVEHLGGGAAFGTAMRLYPDRGVGLVAMANVSSNKFDYEEILKPLEAIPPEKMN
jgi:CubicO group peptidase (beta-lactamase class C family)